MLREELSILISTELNDPRLADALVNVTAVHVSPDLRNARVLIEHALPAASSRQVLDALEHAESYLRQALVETLNLRFVPALHFRIDTTEERARHVDELLDAIAAERRQREREQQSASG